MDKTKGEGGGGGRRIRGINDKGKKTIINK